MHSTSQTWLRVKRKIKETTITIIVCLCKDLLGQTWPLPLLSTLNQPYALRQEFKWRELEEQRKAERLHKRLQQEQAYLLSLQHDSKQQPGDKTKLPSDHSKPPQAATLPPDRALATLPQAQVLNSAVSVARGTCESSRAPQTIPADSSKSQATGQERTDESLSRVSNSPSSLQTETPSDSNPPQTESSEPDSEPVSQPPQPIREVNLLLGSACSFHLPLLACFHTASVVMMIKDCFPPHVLACCGCSGPKQ